MTHPLPLIFSHSHHLLSVTGCSSPPDVLAFEGQENLSQPFSYHIKFTCADSQISRQAMLMKSASLTLQAPPENFGIKIQQPLRVIQGVVTGFDRAGTSRDETRYALTLQPRLALLSRSHQNAIYRDMSVPQIVEKILRERHHMRGQDFLFSLSREYPRREQVMQYGEHDLHFITRLLGEVGIWFRFTADTRLNIDVVEFCDSRKAYAEATTLASVPPAGMHDGGTDSVWGMVCRHQVVEKSVSTRDYNYRQATHDMNARADVTRGDSTTYGEACHYGDNYLTAGDDQAPATESGAFYARLRHERYLNRQTRLSAITTCALLVPGGVMKVTGGTEVGETFSDGVLVTGINSRARRDSSFAMTLTAIPLSDRYSFRPEPPAHPVMAGTLAGRITSTTVNDIYGHIDRDGRYRVKMLFDREDREAGMESLWVRQSRPFAGETYGLHLPLLAGTEVAIAFEHGNPDRPVIAGVLHDSAHPDPVTIRNYRRNVLRTPANNKLRMDDSRGEEHIRLSTEYGGKSQLNLGHLVDGGKQKRGEGFELRTDSFGAIRAQKGIFISADGQAKAQGPQLEMQAALATLQQARNLVDTLRSAAEAARAELADIRTQKSLLTDTLTELKKSALLMSAPEGIALATPGTLQLSAGENLIATGGNNTDFSVLKKFTVAAGEAVSLFAKKLGIKVFASRGRVEIQAQGDEMSLEALKDIRISSSEGKIIISAKKEIVLTSGGGYIRIADGTVECAAPDKIIERGAVWQKFDGQSVNAVFNKFEQGQYESQPQLISAGTEKPLEGLLVSLQSDAGQETAASGSSGHTPKQNSGSPEEISLTLNKGSQ